jgi:uncharacterized protein (DUF427 family)
MEEIDSTRFNNALSDTGRPANIPGVILKELNRSLEETPWTSTRYNFDSRSYITWSPKSTSCINFFKGDDSYYYGKLSTTGQDNVYFRYDQEENFQDGIRAWTMFR